MNRLRRWWVRRLLRKHRVPLGRWNAVVAGTPSLRRLDAGERRRLRLLTARFLHEKTFVGARGVEVTDEMRLAIAAQACLLILNLDFDYYAGWREIIVYPDTFVVEHEVRDGAGVVHETRRALDGEAWEQGPVILAWDQARPGARGQSPAGNIILHEFAHKLDMRNGGSNGMPPLHPDVSRAAWSAALSSAYDTLCDRVDRDAPTPVDPYAAESPAEFFAVLSELFFEQPGHLRAAYPDVYRLFKQFYRQDPLGRVERDWAGG